ncbi:MAG: hypothetical protein L0Z62_06280 [Gemmataceae bacterium]|nr:hypothetical protein [Gemmataceae bacterium]
MFKPGDRVLAGRPVGPHLYPGTVHRQDGPALHILFDDGEEGGVLAAQTQGLQIGPGDRIEVRLPATRSYVPAVVRRCEGDRLCIQFDEDGEQEWTSLGLIRIDPAVWKSGPRMGARTWVVGDRILSQWSGDGLWYPGTVQGVEPERLFVSYDDGDKEWRVLADVVSLDELREGARVFCRWQGGAGFYPGRVTSREGDRIEVHYDDGARETTTVSLVRVRRRPAGASAAPCRAGQRVLAGWDDGRYYPAVIERVEGDSLQVRYDDGGHGRVGAEDVVLLDLRVGDRLWCKWKGGDALYPGQIARIRGEEIYVHYDDGDKETTTVSLACLTALDLRANQARR